MQRRKHLPDLHVVNGAVVHPRAAGNRDGVHFHTQPSVPLGVFIISAGFVQGMCSITVTFLIGTVGQLRHLLKNPPVALALDKTI
jgi:hypothetical protein